MATDAAPPHRGRYVPLSEQEVILRNERREISLLLVDEHLSLTYGSCAAGERVAGPHIHHQHTDGFYVLEGELTFEIGPEPETVTIGAGSLVAAPPGLAHSLRNAGPERARWLTIHAPDNGFADFMRGIRDGVEIEWDIAPVPTDGGLPADHAIISRPY
jgi:mannose-6-phosphate isomerase-like protein (cupin superfamily)